MEVIELYALLDMGLTWHDIQEMPINMIDGLLMLQSAIKEKEEKEMKKTERKMKVGRT